MVLGVYHCLCAPSFCDAYVSNDGHLPLAAAFDIHFGDRMPLIAKVHENYTTVSLKLTRTMIFL